MGLQEPLMIVGKIEDRCGFHLTANHLLKRDGMTLGESSADGGSNKQSILKGPKVTREGGGLT